MIELFLGSLSLSVPRVVGTVSTLDYLRKAPKSLGDDCDIMEARLDQFDTSASSLWLRYCQAVEAAGTPVLATIRLPNDGGKWNENEASRRPLFESALAHLSAIDVETDSALRGDLCELAGSLGKSLVVSYHNFEGTPPVEELCAMVDSVLECPVAIPKLATMVNTQNDVDILKQVLSTYASSRPICVLGMGDEWGTRTRTSFPGLGSKLTYGYLDRPIAPGQLSSAQLISVLSG